MDLDAYGRVEAVSSTLSTALRDSDRPLKPPHFILLEDDIANFANHVLNCLDWRFDTRHVIKLLFLAIIPTEWPSKGFEALRDAAGDAAKSGVCGKVWKQDELAYKCKTCERDPTCVICVQCFKDGDHIGHDFAMIRTSGGCCDCGDAQAWRPSGFCKHHRGACPEDVDPGSSLPPALRRRLSDVVEAVAMFVAGLCFASQNSLRSRPSADAVMHAAGLLNWLMRIAQTGDGIRRVVGSILTARTLHRPSETAGKLTTVRAGYKGQDHMRVSWLQLMLEIDGVEKLPVPLQHGLHAVYFQLITDVVFKRTFLEEFMGNYERYIQAQVERRVRVEKMDHADDSRSHVVDIVEDFTVQLFTVPALVPVMIRQGGLLDILLDLLLSLFEASAAPVSAFSGGVRYSQSSYANGYRRRVSRDHAGAASSSTSLKPMATYSLPNPFSDEDATEASRKALDDTLQRKPVSTGSDIATAGSDVAESTGGEGGRWVTEIATTVLHEPDAMEEDTGQGSQGGVPSSAREPFSESRGEASDLSDSPEGSQRVSPFRSEPGEDLSNSDGPEEDRVFAGTEEPVVMDQDEGLHSGDEQNGLVQDEVLVDDDSSGDDGGGQAVPPETPVRDVDISDLMDQAFEQMVDEPGPEEYEVAANDEVDDGEEGDAFDPQLLEGGEVDPNGDFGIRVQLTVFENGLRSFTNRRSRLSPFEEKSSDVLEASREARKMAPAALSGTGPLAHTMRLSWSEGNPRITDWVCWRVVNDLKYVLTHQTVAFHLLHVRRDLFRKFVRIMSIAQGMNPSIRRFKEHVSIEGDLWAESFAIETEFHYYVELLAVAFCGTKPDTDEGALGGTHEEVGRRINLPSSRLKCIEIVRSCLDEWLDREETIEARSVFEGETFTVAHGISVHLPLHRLLAFMVHHTVRIDNISLHTAISGGNLSNASAEYVRRLLRHPLRIQAFLAQVRAGMWRRNGHPVVGQSTWYCSVMCSEWFVDLDLFLQQCCAIILGPEMFVREVCQAFRVGDFAAVARLPNSRTDEESSLESRSCDVKREVNGQAASSGGSGRGSGESVANGVKALGFLPLAPRRYAEQGLFNHPLIEDAGNSCAELRGFAPSLIEDLLVYIVRISSERSRCGSEDGEFLRRKLLHQLCSRDRTHSQLYRACSYRICNELSKVPPRDDGGDNAGKPDSLVESTLGAIATYVEPKGMEQGKYRLKDELWEEFDPFTPHMVPRDRCAAEVRHAAICKKQGKKMLVISSDVVAMRRTLPQMKGLVDLCMFVSDIDGLATVMLRTALPRYGGPGAVEGALSAALHLVCAAVETEELPSSQSNASYWLNQRLENGYFVDTGPGIVCELYKAALQRDVALYSEFRPVLERILTQASYKGSNSLKSILANVIPQSLSDESRRSGLGRVHDDSEADPERERRRALLRKKKLQQASAMARMRQAQASFAKHIAGDSSDMMNSADKIQGAEENAIPSQRGPASNEEESITERVHSHGTKGRVGSSKRRRNEYHEECALCHEAGSSDTSHLGGDASHLLGLIGFHQNTRLPAIAQERYNLLNPERERSHTESDDGHGSSRSRRLDVGLDVDDAGGSVRIPRLKASPMVDKLELGQAFFLNSQMLRNGVENAENLHMSFCGHAIHIHCFDRYISSLLSSRANESVFEGYNLVNLNKLEFLCPVCRRLANMVLPLMSQASSNTSTQAADEPNLHMELGYEDWISRCSIEFNHGLSRGYCNNHIRSFRAAGKLGAVEGKGPALNSGSHTRLLFRGHARAELGNADGNGLASKFLSRGKAVLQRFGLQSSPASQTRNDGTHGDDVGVLETVNFGPYAKLPSAAISTAACAEVASRSQGYGGANAQSAHRSLSIILREARSQIRMEPEYRGQSLLLLWETLTSENRANVDTFVAFSFLFMLWPEPLDFFEMKNIVRLCLDYLRRQPSVEEIKQATLPDSDLRELLFLRRVSILVHSYFDDLPSPPLSIYRGDGNSSTNAEVRNEIHRLLAFLDVAIPVNERSILHPAIAPLNRNSRRIQFAPMPVGLIKLPKLYQSLLEELDGKRCSKCGECVKGPSLCLVCGDLICGGTSKSCEAGKITVHAHECGAGVGLFLILKSTSVQVIRKARSTMWGSPYLDVHGEEDKRFSRGKPLYLNEERYESLQRLWLTHGFDQDSRILNNTLRARFD